MCSSRRYPYYPHRRDWNFLGAGGFFETKKFKEMYMYKELNWNFQRGREVLGKIPSMGKVWIFSGTTQSSKSHHITNLSVFVQYHSLSLLFCYTLQNLEYPVNMTFNKIYFLMKLNILNCVRQRTLS